MQPSGIDQQKIGARDALRRRKSHFCILFLALAKKYGVWRDATRRLDFNGGEMLQVAGNFLPSMAWADINVGRFCWEGMKVREGVGACSFFHRRRQSPRGGLLFVAAVNGDVH